MKWNRFHLCNPKPVNGKSFNEELKNSTPQRSHFARIAISVKNRSKFVKTTNSSATDKMSLLLCLLMAQYFVACEWQLLRYFDWFCNKNEVLITKHVLVGIVYTVYDVSRRNINYVFLECYQTKRSIDRTSLEVVRLVW